MKVKNENIIDKWNTKRQQQAAVTSVFPIWNKPTKACLEIQFALLSQDSYFSWTTWISLWRSSLPAIVFCNSWIKTDRETNKILDHNPSKNFSKVSFNSCILHTYQIDCNMRSKLSHTNLSCITTIETFNIANVKIEIEYLYYLCTSS